MEQVQFQHLLLETVVCAIACDGVVDEREVAELKKMTEHSHYFKGFQIHDLLDDMLRTLNNNSRLFMGNYLNTLDTAELSYVQQLTILEAILRIIYADQHIDDNEIVFINLVRSRLNLHDEIIYERFGDIPFSTESKSNQYSAKTASPEVVAIADNIKVATEEAASLQKLADKFHDTTTVLKLHEQQKGSK